MECRGVFPRQSRSPLQRRGVDVAARVLACERERDCAQAAAAARSSDCVNTVAEVQGVLARLRATEMITTPCLSRPVSSIHENLGTRVYASRHSRLVSSIWMGSSCAAWGVVEDAVPRKQVIAVSSDDEDDEQLLRPTTSSACTAATQRKKVRGSLRNVPLKASEPHR